MTRSKSISAQPYEYIEIFQNERQVQALATNLETNYKQIMKSKHLTLLSQNKDVKFHVYNVPPLCIAPVVLRIRFTCQQVATNLSISSSCNKSVKIRLVATCHLQTSYNLLKQLVASLWITSFENQLATSLLTTCNRLVVNKLSQAIRTHPGIGLLITSLLQDVNRLVVTCAFFDAYFG